MWISHLTRQFFPPNWNNTQTIPPGFLSSSFHVKLWWLVRVPLLVVLCSPSVVSKGMVSKDELILLCPGAWTLMWVTLNREVSSRYHWEEAGPCSTWSFKKKMNITLTDKSEKLGEIAFTSSPKELLGDSNNSGVLLVRSEGLTLPVRRDKL